MVCLGNICRSPTAEAVMRGLVREAGLEDRIEVESAGMGDWHIGHPPDRRATEDSAPGNGVQQRNLPSRHGDYSTVLNRRTW